MADTFKKVVINDKPSADAKGQYNHDGAINLGTYPYIDNKFLDKDLYSINQSDEINERILSEPNTIALANDSHFTIDLLNIINSGVSYDLNRVNFSIFIADSTYFDTQGIDIDDTTYGVINTALDSKYRIYNSYKGDENEGWSPGALIENGTIFTDLFSTGADYNPDYGAIPQSAAEDYDVSIESGYLSGTLGYAGAGEYPTGENLELYVIVKMEGDADRWFGTDNRDNRIQIFSIPVDEINLAESEDWNHDYAYGDSKVFRGGSSGGGADVPAFHVSALNIRASNVITESIPGFDDADFPVFISNDNYEGIVKARPNRIIQWESTNILGTTILDDGSQFSSEFGNLDFYPVSEVKVADTVDVQSYYTDEDERFKASSPTTVDLSFRISPDIDFGELIDYTAVGNEN